LSIPFVKTKLSFRGQLDLSRYFIDPIQGKEQESRERGERKRVIAFILRIGKCQDMDRTRGHFTTCYDYKNTTRQFYNAMKFTQ